MKPTRPIQAELRINPKPIRSVDLERARAQAGRRVRPSTARVDSQAAIERAPKVAGIRRVSGPAGGRPPGSSGA